MGGKVALSNRQRSEAKRRAPKPPRSLKAGGLTVTEASVVARASELPRERDGLEWLRSRDRLSQQQVREAVLYRQDYREAAEAGPSLKSCLDVRPRASGGSAFGPGGHIVSAMDAQARLYRKRFDVLQGQANLLEVLDGVCGRGITLRELAGGDSRQAQAYEMVLRVALDMLATANVR